MAEKILKQTHQKIRLIQMAKSGHGKTTRALTAARFGKMLILDVDDKAVGATRKIPPILSHIVNEKTLDLVETERITSFDQLVKVLTDLSAATKTTTFPYATVVLDTYTTLNSMIYAEVVGEARLKTGFKPGHDQWGAIRSQLTYVFNQLEKLPCNLIVNCHIAQDKDEKTGVITTELAGQGGHRKDFAVKYERHFLYMRGEKFFVKIRNDETLDINTNLDASLMDSAGNAKIFDLSIFDGYAHTQVPK